MAVKRIINLPKRGIGAKTLETLEQEAAAKDTNMYEILKQGGFGKGKAKESIAKFVEVIEACRSCVDTISIDQLLSKVLEEDLDNGEFVQLMTIHAAKGLEFDRVFVYSLCDGIFPNERSINEGGQQALEEERRLAYVAFTRAKKQLFLSDSYGYSYVLDKLKTTSRFVKEIPQDCLQEVGAKPRNSFASDVDTYQGSGFSSLGNTTRG